MTPIFAEHFLLGLLTYPSDSRDLDLNIHFACFPIYIITPSCEQMMVQIYSANLL